MKKSLQELSGYAGINHLSPVVFQPSKCDACERPIELPSVHFLCKHSFHQRCLRDKTECTVCMLENDMLRELAEAERSNESFMVRLKEKQPEERFDFIIQALANIP